MNAVITERDSAALRYVDRFGLASLSQIATAIYGGARSADVIARRRMRILASQRLVSRTRFGQNSEYVYYAGRVPPARAQHHLMLPEVYNALLRLGGHIEHWEREPDWGALRPDAYCVYLFNGRRFHFSVEIECNTNPWNQDKYEADFHLQSRETAPRFKTYPRVLVVSERDLKVSPSQVRYVVVKSSLDALKQIVM